MYIDANNTAAEAYINIIIKITAVIKMTTIVLIKLMIMTIIISMTWLILIFNYVIYIFVDANNTAAEAVRLSAQAEVIYCLYKYM